MDVEEAAGVECGVYLERRRTLLARENVVVAETAAEITGQAFSFESLVAGYVAGVSGVLIGHPLDTMKVWLQLQMSSKDRSHVLSFRQLYAGVQGPLLTVGFIQALNFGIYGTCRQYLRSRRAADDSVAPPPLAEVALSALTASCIISLPTGILQAIKIRQQQNPELLFRQAATMSLRWSTIQVMTPHFLCESIGRTFYLTSYEIFKNQLVAFRQHDSQRFDESTVVSSLELTLSDRAFCAGLSGTLSWTLIFPIDVLRSRMFAVHAAGDGSTQQTSTWKMARSMFKKEGWRPFTRGMSMAVVRAAPVAAAVLPVYDVTHHWLLSLGR